MVTIKDLGLIEYVFNTFHFLFIIGFLLEIWDHVVSLPGI